MFNGIIFNQGKIKKIINRKKGSNLFLKSNLKLSKKDLGVSICCDGVCLTLVSLKNGILEFYLSKETIKRSKFEHMKNEQDHFEVLRKIQSKPESSQRELAEELGFSLGKLNYCLKSLQKKGFVKLQNFQKKKNKITYLRYVITPKGISERTKLTVDFMKRKMKEYDELKNELEDN